jgi:hypothetical protein
MNTDTITVVLPSLTIPGESQSATYSISREKDDSTIGNATLAAITEALKTGLTRATLTP